MKTDLTLSLILRFNLRLGGYSIWRRVLHAPYMIKVSGLEHLTASEQLQVLGELLDVPAGRPKSNQKEALDYPKNSKMHCQVLDACRTRL